MAVSLPPPIAGYFAADQHDDAGVFLRNFTEDAVVMDERRTYSGHDEIRQWKQNASAQYSYTAEPFAIADADGRTVVTAHLTGDFPGSPVDLRYRFTLHDGLIAALDIGP